MNDHQKRLQKLHMRVGAAVLAFVVFLGMNVNAGLIGAEARTWGLASIAPLALAYFALPRRIPRLIGADVSGDADLARSLDRLIKFIQGLRVAFIVLALFVLLALPRLVPAPI